MCKPEIDLLLEIFQGSYFKVIEAMLLLLYENWRNRMQSQKRKS